MSDYTIRTMDESELHSFYKHIQRDFPVGEYPPYEILSRQFREGLQEGLVLGRENRDLAYSICAASTDWVLLSLMAVFPEYRGRGVGSALLRALHSKYICKRVIIGEVERPELASDSVETSLRYRRIDFYKKAGYHLIQGIDYTIWDVPMHLMALPINCSRKAVDEDIQTIVYKIYLQLMGKHFMDKLSLIPKPENMKTVLRHPVVRK